MASATRVLSTSNFAITTYDYSQVFIGKNEFQQFTFTYTNSTYDDVVINTGALLGQKTADSEVILLESGASDGSQFPIGLLAQDITVEAGDTFDGTVSVCVAGRVVESKVGFQGSDDLETVVDGKTLKARIGADTVGIVLEPAVENTSADNS